MGGKTGVSEDSQKSMKGYSEKLKELSLRLESMRGTRVLVLFLGDRPLSKSSVTDIYDKLQKEFGGTTKLDILLDSPGGDIDAAYMMTKLFRRYGSEKLTFIIPRWAKSAATLLACGGDEIIMGPISELGPLDPQITDTSNPKGIQQLSPLSIKSSINLIREEADEGSEKLAKMMADKLLPLTLGTYIKSLEIGKVYQEELLKTRMLKDKPDCQKIASTIGEKFVKGYPHHGYCIDYDEALKLGLNVVEPEKEEWELIWQIYKIYVEDRKRIRREKYKNEKSEIFDKLKKLTEGLGGV